jgi:hypothetical protein
VLHRNNPGLLTGKEAYINMKGISKQDIGISAGFSSVSSGPPTKYKDVCMYVCIRGGLLQPLHLDPQWSIVLNPYDR